MRCLNSYASNRGLVFSWLCNTCVLNIATLITHICVCITTYIECARGSLFSCCFAVRWLTLQSHIYADSLFIFLFLLCFLWSVYFTYVYILCCGLNKQKSPLITKYQSHKTQCWRPRILWMRMSVCLWACFDMDIERHKIVRLMNVSRCILWLNTLSSYAYACVLKSVWLLLIHPNVDSITQFMCMWIASAYTKCICACRT